jgi:hypothetical protein
MQNMKWFFSNEFSRERKRVGDEKILRYKFARHLFSAFRVALGQTVWFSPIFFSWMNNKIFHRGHQEKKIALTNDWKSSSLKVEEKMRKNGFF